MSNGATPGLKPIITFVSSAPQTTTVGMEDIKKEIKEYIIKEFADEADTGPIREDTPLLSSGILDSISALQLVQFLEERYSFSFKAHEVDQDNLDNLLLIEAFVRAKMTEKTGAK